LPNVPVHCAAWDVDGILVGTDIGAFFLPHGTDEWVYYSQGLPTVGVTEIEIHNTILGKKVFASTWGRGIWYASPPVPPRQTRWYVDSSATGLNNGANWTNAFTKLQTALDTIVPGDSIWVAKGTYYPDSLVGFHLAFNDIFIWGGFAGVEDSVDQRDFEANPTILSGDIGFAGDSTDNTHHVFMFDGQNGNVVLDGFHITEGNADGQQEASKGGGIYYATNHQNGKPIIRNCKIYNNTALGGGGLPQHHGAGGGMYILDSDVGDPHMYVSDCSFENNYGYEGGGLYIDSERMFLFMVQNADTGTADVHLINCQFDENEAFARGGGVFLEAGRGGTVSLTMDTVSFDANRIGWASGDGGAIYGDARVSTPGTLEVAISNTSFNDHVVSSEGGAIYIDGEGAVTDWQFDECSFNNNTAFTGGAVFNYYPGVNSESALVFNDCSFTNNSASSGGAIQMNGFSRASAEAHFKRCTLNNNSASGRGGAIFFNGDTGGSFTVTIDSTAFCNNTADENGAIRAYFRRLTNNPEPDGLGDFTITHSSFDSNSTTGAAQGGAIVFWCDGAYVSASISETDFTANTTGTLGGAVAFVHQANDTSTLAATFHDCDFLDNTAPFGNGDFGGGALFLDKMDATLTDCSFTGNQGKYGGAVVVRAETKAKTYTHLYNNCVFKANTGSEYGGALSLEHNSPATLDLDIVLTAFDSNYTTSVLPSEGLGGAIYHFGTGRCVSEITNSAFLDNYGSTDGGAIYASGQLSSPMDTLFLTVDSCIFVNNDAGATEKSVELFGHQMRIESYWKSTNFFNHGQDYWFRNRADGTGYARATFADCNFNIIVPPLPPVAGPPAPSSQQNNAP
ncbi:MAG: hypothetical protein R3330_04555, partial [Saprospiraceae bacterium]|nr:hypothetical protein [Saprospiraceae bacterium]